MGVFTVVQTFVIFGKSSFAVYFILDQAGACFELSFNRIQGGAWL